MLELKGVSFRYPQPGSPLALKEINLAIEQGVFLALVGASGSGKSTLLLQLNGLLKPSQGEVLFKGSNIHAKGYNLKGLRRQVGLLFQFPEASFFGATVYEDIAFGPANHGKRGHEVDLAVDRALDLVGLDRSFKSRSPFALSGGEKRRVALAGILAMEPEVLLLDEPTAGLDPGARAKLLKLLSDLNKQGISVIMVTHEMDEVAAVAGKVVFMAQGRMAAEGPVRELLYGVDFAGLDLEEPEIISLGKSLAPKGQGVPVLTEREAVDAILGRRG